VSNSAAAAQPPVESAVAAVNASAHPAGHEVSIGIICLRQRPLPSHPDTVVTEITVDHEFLMSSRVTASERALARRGLEQVEGSGLRVLVGGLGLGYTAREALRSARVARVEVVELLAPVIGWLERDLIPLAQELKSDPRLSVVEGDVYARLAGPPGWAEASDAGRWDLILVDVDHSPDEPLGQASAAFYEPGGLARAMRHLAPGGVLAVWSYQQSERLAEALGAVSCEFRVELVTFINDVAEGEETNWLFFGRRSPRGP